LLAFLLSLLFICLCCIPTLYFLKRHLTPVPSCGLSKSKIDDLCKKHGQDRPSDSFIMRDLKLTYTHIKPGDAVPKEHCEKTCLAIKDAAGFMGVWNAIFTFLDNDKDGQFLWDDLIQIYSAVRLMEDHDVKFEELILGDVHPFKVELSEFDENSNYGVEDKHIVRSWTGLSEFDERLPANDVAQTPFSEFAEDNPPTLERGWTEFSEFEEKTYHTSKQEAGNILCQSTPQMEIITIEPKTERIDKLESTQVVFPEENVEVIEIEELPSIPLEKMEKPIEFDSVSAVPQVSVSTPHKSSRSMPKQVIDLLEEKIEKKSEEDDALFAEPTNTVHSKKKRVVFSKTPSISVTPSEKRKAGISAQTFYQPSFPKVHPSAGYAYWIHCLKSEPMIEGEIMVKVTIDKLASEDEVTFFGCNIRFSNLDSESLGGCSWEVTRRFSDYHTFHKQIQAMILAENARLIRLLPTFPLLFAKWLYDHQKAEFIQNRRASLEKYLMTLTGTTNRPRMKFAIDRCLAVLFNPHFERKLTSKDFHGESLNAAITRPAYVVSSPLPEFKPSKI